MSRQAVAWHVIPDDMGATDRRLQNWARWLAPSRGGRDTSPMFRWAKSNDNWSPAPVRDGVNVLEATETERRVRSLPEEQREAVRWYYVYQGSPLRQARRMGVTPADLQALLWAGMRSVSICRK